jgi:hypothetical protein
MMGIFILISSLTNREWSGKNLEKNGRKLAVHQAEKHRVVMEKNIKWSWSTGPVGSITRTKSCIENILVELPPLSSCMMLTSPFTGSL